MNISTLEDLIQSNTTDFIILSDDQERIYQWFGTNTMIYNKKTFFSNSFLSSISGKTSNNLKLYLIGDDEREKHMLSLGDLPLLVYIENGIQKDQLSLMDIMDQTS
jgi:hypothetical protein